MVTKDSQKENHPSGENLRLQLPSDQMAEYCRRVVSHLEEEKRYLNPNYSLWDCTALLYTTHLACQNDIQIYQ